MAKRKLNELLFRPTGETSFVDANEVYGVRMGDGFIEALRAPVQIKDLVENENRNQHGKRVIKTNIKLSSREVTLTFRIIEDSQQAMNDSYNKFINLLYGVFFDIKIPKVSEDIYHLRYLGKSTSYGHNLARTSCMITAKFEESNPYDRE